MTETDNRWNNPRTREKIKRSEDAKASGSYSEHHADNEPWPTEPPNTSRRLDPRNPDGR